MEHGPFIELTAQVFFLPVWKQLPWGGVEDLPICDSSQRTISVLDLTSFRWRWCCGIPPLLHSFSYTPWKSMEYKKSQNCVFSPVLEVSLINPLLKGGEFPWRVPLWQLSDEGPSGARKLVFPGSRVTGCADLFQRAGAFRWSAPLSHPASGSRAILAYGVVPKSKPLCLLSICCTWRTLYFSLFVSFVQRQEIRFLEWCFLKEKTYGLWITH